MEKNDSYDFLPDQLSALIFLVRQLHDQATPFEVTEEIVDQITKLRDDVEEFCKLSPTSAINHPPGDAADDQADRQFFKRLDHLKKEIENVQVAIALDLINKEQDKAAAETQKKPTEVSKELKKKLKPIGSKKNWQRM